VALGDDALRAELTRIRAELDSLDSELIRVIKRRLDLGLEAASIKADLGIPIRDPEREERAILQAAEWARSSDLPVAEVEEIFRRLISLSRDLQIKTREDQ
jgi:chorismate mutase